jgi:hypothetical protein
MGLGGGLAGLATSTPTDRINRPARMAATGVSSGIGWKIGDKVREGILANPELYQQMHPAAQIATHAAPGIGGLGMGLLTDYGLRKGLTQVENGEKAKREKADKTEKAAADPVTSPALRNAVGLDVYPARDISPFPVMAPALAGMGALSGTAVSPTGERLQGAARGAFTGVAGAAGYDLARRIAGTPGHELSPAGLAAGGLLAYLTHAGLKQELRDNEKDRAARRVRTEKDKEGLRAKQADDPLPAGGDAKNVSAVPVFHSGDESAPPDARLLIQQKLAPRLPTPTLGAKPRLIWDAATGVMDPARGGAFEPAGYSKAWPVPQDWASVPTAEAPGGAESKVESRPWLDRNRGLLGLLGPGCPCRGRTRRSCRIR